MNSWFYVGFVEGKDQCKANEAQDNNFNANVKVDAGTRKHKIPPELMHSFKTMQDQIKQKHSAKQSPGNSTHTYTYIMLVICNCTFLGTRGQQRDIYSTFPQIWPIFYT